MVVGITDREKLEHVDGALKRHVQAVGTACITRRCCAPHPVMVPDNHER